MKIIIIIVGLCFFNGCNSPKISNQEIIKKCKECADAGLRAVVYNNILNGEIVDVVCYPKKESN